MSLMVLTSLLESSTFRYMVKYTTQLMRGLMTLLRALADENRAWHRELVCLPDRRVAGVGSVDGFKTCFGSAAGQAGEKRRE